jgi:hypothetical protein
LFILAFFQFFLPGGNYCPALFQFGHIFQGFYRKLRFFSPTGFTLRLNSLFSDQPVIQRLPVCLAIASSY